MSVIYDGWMLKSRLGLAKQTRLIENFVAGTTARTAAVLVGTNKSMTTNDFLRLRMTIAQVLREKRPFE